MMLKTDGMDYETIENYIGGGKGGWNDGFGPSSHELLETDRLLSSALLRLSVHDRNAIHEEIHGVRDFCPKVEENPELLNSSLLEIDHEIKSILYSEKSHAGLRIEDVTTNPELRLTFLRTEAYDVKKAARRFLSYVWFIRTYCACGGGAANCNCGSLGDKATGGRINAEKWFTPDEYSELQKGSIQMMPFRDQSGRRVLVVLSGCFRMPMLMRVKIVNYLLSGCSEDIETQKKGFVALVWPGMCHVSKGVDVVPSLSNVAFQRRLTDEYQNAMPVRLVGLHFCSTSSPILKFARMTLSLWMRDESRVRFNAIEGSQVELNYKIMGFGIHPEMIPVTNNGMIKKRNHLQWLETRKGIEKQAYGSLKHAGEGGSELIDCPGMNDVLFYRGKSCQHHPGNVAFRSMLESKKLEHLTANQTRKKDIAYQIMIEVENCGGRFLCWDKAGWWIQLENRSEIRHKVATSLRDFNKTQIKAAKNLQNTHSSTNLFRNPEERKRKRDDSGDSSDDGSANCMCFL